MADSVPLCNLTERRLACGFGRGSKLCTRVWLTGAFGTCVSAVATFALEPLNYLYVKLNRQLSQLARLATPGESVTARHWAMEDC